MTDERVHAAIVEDPDAEPTGEAFWKDARVVMPRRKEAVTMRLDADLLAWFRSERGYQNAHQCDTQGVYECASQRSLKSIIRATDRD